MRASSGSPARATSSPLKKYSPLVGRSRQPRIDISVDLPDPDAPMIATSSPRSMVNVTPRSAWMSTSPT